jgi:cytochrome c biogenesis protein CcmG/thiol:disulfide interchange protein DsbE
MLLGIIMRDSPAAARAFQAELGGDWPLLVDPEDKTLVDFGVRSPPETFVVNADGIIVTKFSGRLGPGQLDEVVAADTRLAGG